MSLFSKIVSAADKALNQAAQNRILSDYRSSADADKWFVRRWITTANDPCWQADFLQYCESPAEEAFLQSAISSFRLEPDKGSLIGEIKLSLQVRVKPYRLDFLVNDMLVVEVDGAAYHSSAEALKRDSERDRYLQSLRYSILRVPAKVVFNEPQVAMNSIRTAIRQRPQTKPPTAHCTNILW
ncbi:endonuclease domain-containing protein [Novosphingobium sp. BL-52-GroH]|uniref:endonuclease domain-containing protein n=1 Tax=Novosphingobium sp. BL-52-GroH TaxID=3349877 RepID=UPI00384A9184